MMEAILLAVRWPSDDYVARWFTEQTLLGEERWRLSMIEPLVDVWKPIACNWSPPDAPKLDIRWFGVFAPSLDDETGDDTFARSWRTPVNGYPWAEKPKANRGTTPSTRCAFLE